MKIGDYIRTKDGIIAKITDVIADYSIDCDRDVFDLKNGAMMEIPWNYKDEYIIKSDSKVIKVIDIGDYVNGFPVIHKTEDEIMIFSLFFRLKEEDIETIVTKEQFKNQEYKI